MKALLTEFVGVFLFIFTIALSVAHAGAMAPIPIGLALMVLVYMGGHVSGAHYNPAVTLAVFMRGKLPAAQVGPYMLAQVAGGVAAGLVARTITGDSFAAAPGDGVALSSALLVEVLFTFMLALVVLNVATVKKTEGNSYYGAAIGLTLTAAAFAGGSVSGGAFNPAVGLGPILAKALLGGGFDTHVWLYLAGPFIGGAAAAAAFKAHVGTGD